MGEPGRERISAGSREVDTVTDTDTGNSRRQLSALRTLDRRMEVRLDWTIANAKYSRTAHAETRSPIPSRTFQYGPVEPAGSYAPPRTPKDSPQRSGRFRSTAHAAI